MGRKSKIKQARKQKAQQPTSEVAQDSNSFVEQLGKQGYQLNNIQRSPELPNKKIDPQI